jgi:integrase
VGEYLDYWLENVARQTVRPTTFAKYEQTVRLYFKPGLGGKSLERLCVATVQTFLNGQLKTGHSVPKVRVMRTVLSAALTRAMREELIAMNAARLTTLPAEDPRRVKPWSADEARRFFVVARNDPLYLAFVLLLVHGLRRGEVCGLAWEDVDLDEDVIYIRRQVVRVGGELVRQDVKTKAGRRGLPILPIVREGLIDQAGRQSSARKRAGRDWYETGLVLTTRTGRGIEPRNLARSFERIVTTNGLRLIRLHDLRHSVAQLLKRLKVPPRDAMQILGHSRIAVTMEVYTGTKRAHVKLWDMSRTHYSANG